MSTLVPIQTLHPFPVLDQKLMKLLRSLSSAEGEAQTVAKL